MAAMVEQALWMTFAIRPALVGDGVVLREIERLAGEQFRQVGLDVVADDEPPSLDSLARYAVADLAWVAVDGAGTPIGYVLVDVVDSCAHVEQISVRPDRQGTGVGRALLDQVRAWAVETNRPAITLTTFADVPWNRPLYEHLGFRVLPEDDLTPPLLAIRRHESELGLDPSTRVVMRRDVRR
jgi:GNAT superfamily N-acetyltransferase